MSKGRAEKQSGLLTFTPSRTPPPDLPPICPIRIGMDKVVLILGLVHLLFGLAMIGLQFFCKSRRMH